MFGLGSCYHFHSPESGFRVAQSSKFNTGGPFLPTVLPIRNLTAGGKRRARVVRRVNERNLSTTKKENKVLDAALKEFINGVKNGENPDDIVRRQLGFEPDQVLTETQQEYVQKAKQKMEELSQDVGDEKSNAFKFGEICYGRGEYEKSSIAFEIAIKEAGAHTIAGGEASLWLALAYQAMGREEECLELYKDLKENHENKKIRKKAENLLFIMEAPKLQIREDEKVQMPVLKNLDRNTGRGIGIRPKGAVLKKKVKKSLEEEYWDNYKPPKYVQNKYFWIATSVLTVGLIWYTYVFDRWSK